MPARPSRKKKTTPGAAQTPQAIQAERDRKKIERARELSVNTTIDQFQGRKSVARG